MFSSLHTKGAIIVSLKSESFLPRTEHEGREVGNQHPYIVLAVTDGDPPLRPLEFSPWSAVRIEGTREGAHTWAANSASSEQKVRSLRRNSKGHATS